MCALTLEMSILCELPLRLSQIVEDEWKVLEEIWHYEVLDVVKDLYILDMMTDQWRR